MSVLWALSDDPWVRAEVLAAHDTAVVAALDWFEQHGAVTRRGTDGVHQVDTQGVAAALFRQHTSRCIDPQIHTHAVIAAKVQDPTGRWLALDARFLKRQQRAIGWLYAAALRSELTARLGLSWGPMDKGHADIEGVPSGLAELFSKRTAQVEAALAKRIAHCVDEHDGAEPDARTIARLERRAVLASRPDKEAAIDADTLRAEWLGQARAAGFEPPSLPGRTRGLPGPRACRWRPWAAVGEAIGLRVCDVDFMRRTVTVTQVVEEVAGHVRVVPGEAKTAGSLRTIAAPAFLIDELARHLGEHRATAVGDRLALVFVGPRGGLLRRRFAERTFRPAVERAGLDPAMAFHGLRHVAMSTLVDANVHPRVMQSRAGHASSRLTMEVYSHVAADTDRDAADALEERFSAPFRDANGHVAGTPDP